MIRNSIKWNALVPATAIALALSGGAWAQAANDTGKAGQATEQMAIPGDAAKQPAAADQAAPKPVGDDTATAGQPPAAEPGQAPAADSVIAAQEDGQALISDVVGATVETPDGDDLGKIDDLIVDRDGKLQGAVLSVGGFLGIGDKRVAVPWQAVQQNGPDQALVVALTKDQLEAAPEFKTLADQQAERQAALAPPSAAVPAPATGGGSQ